MTTPDNVGGPLLETKLYVPKPRRGLVARPRLSERLSRGAESKLTVISAPPGFGKTTLLAEWLASAPAGEQSAAWLSLDPALGLDVRALDGAAAARDLACVRGRGGDRARPGA